MPDASYTPHVGTIDSATITLICLRCGLMESERILEKGDRLAVPIGGRRGTTSSRWPSLAASSLGLRWSAPALNARSSPRWASAAAH